VKGNIHALPVSGPLTVKHELLLLLDAVVVVVVVVVIVVDVVHVTVHDVDDVVDEVVDDVVDEVVEEVVHVFVLHTATPLVSQTQVLQSTVKLEPGVQLLEDPECNGQDEGQNPSFPSMCSPATSVFVLHQDEPRSTEVQPLYTIPLYLKGKTH